MNPLLIAHPLLVTLVAEEGPKNTGPDFGKASPVGLLVVVLLLIGVFALVWSMNRHLKRIPESFDAPEATTASRPDGGAAAAPAAPTAPTSRDGESAGESGG